MTGLEENSCPYPATSTEDSTPGLASSQRPLAATSGSQSPVPSWSTDMVGCLEYDFMGAHLCEATADVHARRRRRVPL